MYQKEGKNRFLAATTCVEGNNKTGVLNFFYWVLRFLVLPLGSGIPGMSKSAAWVSSSLCSGVGGCCSLVCVFEKRVSCLEGKRASNAFLLAAIFLASSGGKPFVTPVTVTSFCSETENTMRSPSCILRVSSNCWSMGSVRSSLSVEVNTL